MDRSQLLNNPEMALRAALTSWQAGMWTAMPGIVQSVDLTKMTLVAQLAIQGVVTDSEENETNEDISPLVDVPICFPSGGGFILTMPIAVGDEVLVVLASRCIDSWWQNGGYQNVPMETRMHDLSDGFAIPGPKSLPKSAQVVGVSASGPQLRTNDGTAYVGISSANLIELVNSTNSLRSLLNGLITAIETFVATGVVSSGAGSGGTLSFAAGTAAFEAYKTTIAGLLQ